MNTSDPHDPILHPTDTGRGAALLLSASLGLEHSLDDGSLLDQERSGDSGWSASDPPHHTSTEIGTDVPLLDAGSATASTVSPVDGLLSLGDGSV